MINRMHVLGTHAPRILVLGFTVLLALIVNQVVLDLFGQDCKKLPSFYLLKTVHVVALAVQELFGKLYLHIAQSKNILGIFSTQVQVTALILAVTAYLVWRDHPIYLLSFATFQPPDEWKCSHEDIVEMMKRQNCFTGESLDFMKRIFERSGTGQATAWPPGIVQSM